MDDMTKQILTTAAGSVVRHAMTTAAGALVTDGLVQAGDSDSFVKIGTGIVMGVGALGLSWWQKSGQAQVTAALKKLTAKNTTTAAVATAQALPTGAAVTKALAIFAVLLASLVIAMPAMAQTTPTKRAPAIELNGPCNPLGDTRPQCQAQGSPAPIGQSGSPQNDMVALWKKIVGAANSDLTYAVAMATSANANAPKGVTTGAGMRLQCLQAIQTLNQQATGQNVKDAQGNVLPRPDPALFTDAETLAEVIDAVQPGGPLWTSCAGAAQLASTSTIAFINALVSGTAGLALLAPIK